MDLPFMPPVDPAFVKHLETCAGCVKELRSRDGLSLKSWRASCRYGARMVAPILPEALMLKGFFMQLLARGRAGTKKR